MKRGFVLVCIAIGVFVFSVSFTFADHGAALSLMPQTGTFVVGSTFDVSLYLDTDFADVNAVAVFLSFPPDKLQVISSSAGKSVIDLWSVPPRFNNQTGTVELQGVITSGLNATDALITTLTFRARSTGSAVLSITDGSRVLKHDGNGTDYLQHEKNAIYTLALPPPAGPLVVSETHPNQEKWYRDTNISLVWNLQDGSLAQGYSYLLNTTPIDIPDNISEGIDQSVIYQQISEGTKYFHIKALRAGAWGGTTHFAINIDTAEPAKFPIEVSPSTRTNDKQPVVRFITTDAHSGMSHYELKIIQLSPKDRGLFLDQPLFIEIRSPYVLPKLERGKYDVIVRAYDRAGNFRESIQRIVIRDVFFGLISDEGFEVDDWFVIPWKWVVFFFILIIAILIYVMLLLYHWEHELGRGHAKGLPVPVQNQLRELKKYHDRYGKIGIFFLVISMSFFLISEKTTARELKVEPPLITTLSRNITNQDIFYVGGKTNIPKSTVVFYVQNITTGESNSFEVLSDEYGDWFYSHDTFLSNGEYLLWAQNKVGDIASAPGPQEQLHVQPTAVQFGSSRLSYNVIYQIALAVMVAVIGFLVSLIMQMRRRVQKRKERLLKEVREAEEAVRKGFAVLKRDIQRELEIIGKAKIERSLREEEEKRETQLLADLVSIQRRIGKEIWDIETLG